MTTSPLTLLRWTRFESDSAGTGPEKRSAQILALCTDAGFAVHDMQPPARLPRWRTYAAGLGARRRFGRHASVDRASIGLLGFRAAFYRNALSRHQGARVLLWETTYDTLLPAFARDAGFRVIALPHNLEAAHGLGLTTVLVRSTYVDHPSQRQVKETGRLPHYVHFVTSDLTEFIRGLPGAAIAQSA